MSATGPSPATSRWHEQPELDGATRVGPASDEDAPRGPWPRPGWYAYRVAGPTRVPPWAIEVALTIERPAGGWEFDPGQGLSGHPGGGWEIGPGTEGQEGGVDPILMLRAPGRSRLLEDVAEVAREIEAAAGLRPAGPRLRLLSGPPLPGLTPVMPSAAQAHIAMAGARGLPAPLRRRQPAASGSEASWRSSAGSVLTCEGPAGASAQAVVGLQGLGNPAAITPPPGGAVVLRAWQGRRAWGLVCGLVLGSAETLGLGREAGRAAAAARGEGWDAGVLRGPAALHLARAGDPRRPPPHDIGHAASSRRVHAMIEACLTAGGLEQLGGDQIWSLPVTP